jgi:hydrogenase maturation factor
MNRFMGMMPSSEIAQEKRFKVGMSQLIVTIQAGKNGWTILYADSSSEYKDEVDSVENNFKKAMELLKTQFSGINKVG